MREATTRQRGKGEYLLWCMVDTLATFHALTSLSNLEAPKNTARREKVRVRIQKNVARGDGATAGWSYEYLLSDMVDTLATSHLLTSLLKILAWWNTARRESARQDGNSGTQRQREDSGKEEYLLLFIFDTLPTFHLLTSLSNFSAWWNTVKRE